MKKNRIKKSTLAKSLGINVDALNEFFDLRKPNETEIKSAKKWIENFRKEKGNGKEEK